nr:MAG: major capsid protein [Microviridae sp.]
MKPLFNQVKVNRQRKNAFDLSHEKKLSFDMGNLIPILLQEVIPGDKFKVNTEVLVRFAPMIAPMMHRVNVYTHYFFVPNRLVWKNWQNFITGAVDGLYDGTTQPTMTPVDGSRTMFAKGCLSDYFGINPIPAAGAMDSITLNALPFRGYQLIYNEFYRDQTLNAAAPMTTDDTVAAPEQTSITTLRQRSWEKDYFTSALPWTQRGGQVNIPSTPNYKTNPLVTYAGGTVTSGDAIKVYNSANPSNLMEGVSGQPVTKIDNLNGVDVSVINLRRAVRLQEWLEKNATAGSRYIEQILAHFGVRSSDARLQRPEYLGGGRSPVVISEVVSMVNDTAGSHPQGTLAGHGISVGNHMGFNKYFEEHGFVFGIMSVMPRTAYYQGIPRVFSKVDRFDYYWPEFAQIGEQAILNKELFADWIEGTDNNEAIFGYTPRYAEYRFNNSSVHGDFRDTLNFWHMSRSFVSGGRPILNSNFVTADPTNRVFAVSGGNHLWVQLYNGVKAIRPIPVFGTPTL